MSKVKKQHIKARSKAATLFHPGDHVEFRFVGERAKRGVIVEKRGDRLVVRDPGPLKSWTEEVRFAAVEYVRLAPRESSDA